LTSLITEGEVFVCEEVFPDLQLCDDKERGGKSGREEEGKARCQEGLSVGQLGLRGMEDEPVSVKSYKEDGEGGEEDTAGLDGTDHLAENAHLWSPGPVLAQNIYAGEWHGEGAEQDVRDGKGGDEHISGGQRHLQNTLHQH
jgi:hypothetical protein